MDTKEVLSYRAINVFFEREYLEKVLNSVLEGLKALPKEKQQEFNSNFRKYVKVLGFRDPVRAPLSLQINAFVNAFETKEEIIPITLTSWAIINLPFVKQVLKWLESEGWNNLNYDRTYLHNEGFASNWDEQVTFDQIDEDFKKAQPDIDYERNDLILMVLWLSGKLPKV